MANFGRKQGNLVTVFYIYTDDQATIFRNRVLTAPDEIAKTAPRHPSYLRGRQ
jgi:hypothetical protein